MCVPIYGHDMRGYGIQRSGGTGSALERGGDGLGERGGRAAGQPGEVAAVDDELALLDRDVHVRENGGHRLGHAGAGQDAGERLGRDRVVDDLPAGLPAQLGRVLGEAPRLVAAQLVRRVLVSLAGQYGDGGGRVVGSRGGGDPALTGGGQDRAVLQHGGEVLRVVLVVPAVAQQHIRYARAEQHL